MMGEKGDIEAMTILVILIFTLVVGFALFMFYENVLKAQGNLAGKALCQNSILFSSKDHNPDFSRSGCNPARVEFDESRYYDDDIEGLVKKDIADLMVGCWRMAGEGKLNPYPNSVVFKTRWSSCNSFEFILICDIVEFENIEPFDGLNFWMIEHQSSLKTKSYFEYLYESTSQDIIDRHAEKSDSYETSKDYAVVWVDVRSKIPDELKQIIPVEVDKKWSGVLFLPYDELITESIDEDYSLDLKECVFVMN